MDQDAERPRLPEFPEIPERALEMVRELARDFRRIDEERRAARDLLGQALTLAHRRGYSWVDIAEATEFLRGATAQQWSLPLAAQDPAGEADGVPVAEAAAALGISTVTAYSWIKSGRLRSTKDASGRLRVIMSAAQQDG